MKRLIILFTSILLMSAQGGKISLSKNDIEILREKYKAFAHAQMEWEVTKALVAHRYIKDDMWKSSQYDQNMTHIVPRYQSAEVEDVSLRIGK